MPNEPHIPTSPYCDSSAPKALEALLDLIDKKRLTNIVNQCQLIVGNYKTVIFLDNLKDLGITGTPIQSILFKYIYRFRTGGQFG